jgi:hypothetical protein
VIVPFVVTDTEDKVPTAVPDGAEVPTETVTAGVVTAVPDEEPAAVGREVGVSDARTPVKLYDAAQAARDNPYIGLEDSNSLTLKPETYIGAAPCSAGGVFGTKVS